MVQTSMAQKMCCRTGYRSTAQRRCAPLTDAPDVKYARFRISDPDFGEMHKFSA